MYKIIFGSYTTTLADGKENSDGIYTGTFDSADGKILVQCRDNHACNPSFLCVSPDNRLLVAVNEKSRDGALDSYLLNEEGMMQWIEKQPIEGSACCYVEYAAGGNYIIGTNYGDGSVFSYAIDADGHFGVRRSFCRHEGSGPVLDRQEHAHAHSMRHFPGESFMIACDLGADKLLFYQYDKDGTLTPYQKQSYIDTPPGFGPRHMEFSADHRYLYVAGELSNQMLVYAFENSAFRQIQLLPTLPADFKGVNLVADVHLHPNGKWLYVSNRGHDSITQYQVEANGMLTWLNNFSCGGNGPRNFAVCETHLICTNQISDNVAVFLLDESGKPQYTTDDISIPSPTFILLLK